MRLHTDKTPEQILEAFESCKPERINPSTRLEYSVHGSRSHRNSLEFKLISTAAPDGWEKRRRQNAYGVPYGDGEFSGTWAEHGYFMAAVYGEDPVAVFGRSYSDYYDFHEKTIGLFGGDYPLEKTYARALAPGDYISGWNVTGSAFGIVSAVSDKDSRTRDVHIDLYGGPYGYRYTETIPMSKDRKILRFIG